MGDIRESMENYSVEGEWNGFEFKTISKADYPMIKEHIHRVFCHGEPVLSLIGYSQELGNDLWNFITHNLDKNNGLSFYAVHKATQKLAGVRITYRNDKGETDPPMHFQSAETGYVFNNVLKMEEAGNICERYAISFYAELLVASVDPEFRQQGLVTEMYRRTFNLLRSKGYPAAECMFTSPITRKVAEKFGFEEIQRKYFKDFVDAKGARFIHNAADDQFGALMFIKL